MGTLLSTSRSHTNSLHTGVIVSLVSEFSEIQTELENLANLPNLPNSIKIKNLLNVSKFILNSLFHSGIP